MTTRALTIELDAETAEVLEARAASGGLSVSAVIAELVGDDQYDPEIERMRREGPGPYSPEALAEDEVEYAEFLRTGEAVPMQDVLDWIGSWGTANELPRPMPRKL